MAKQTAQQLPAGIPEGAMVEDADSAPQPEDYVFVDDLRLVRPYYFDFRCHVKQRQDGRPLVELMTEEFPMLGADYYLRAVAQGRLRVELQGRAASASGKGGGKGKGGAGGSGKDTAAAAAAAAGPEWPLDRALRSGMCIRHFLHRHEPPVLAGAVEVLGVTPDYVAVAKPACMPVHTVGQYRKNTVMGVLQAYRPDLWPLYPTYRLDKPVSGVLLLARSGAAASAMRQLLEERTCHKAYVARVQGVFPAGSVPAGPAPAGAAHAGGAAADAADAAASASAASGEEGSGPQTAAREGSPAAAGDAGGAEDGCCVVVVDVALGWDARINHAFPVIDGAPPPGVAPSLASTAKPAITHFRRLSVAPDGRTSLVEAIPKTGRTHQIRVHLQHLGHPIANDTQYGGMHGQPMFFRRGLGTQLQPHVNGARSRQQGEALPSAPAPACSASPAAAPDEATVAAAPHAAQSCAHPGGAGDEAAPPSPSPSPSRKRRKAADAAQQHGQQQQQQGQGAPAPALPTAGSDVQSGSGPAPEDEQQCLPQHEAGQLQQRLQGGGSGEQPDGAAAAAAAGDASGSGGDASPSECASSARYLALYSDPKFRVEGCRCDPLCPHCPCLVPEGYPIDLEPLWLHARRYSLPGQGAFEAPLPAWADHGYCLPAPAAAEAAAATAGRSPGAG